MQLFTSFVVVITHTLFQICLPSSSSFDSFILCVPPCLFPSLPIASPRFPSRPVVYVKFNLAVLTGVVAGVIAKWYWSSHGEDHAKTKKGRWQVFVKTIDGTTLTLNTAPTATVATLLRQIADEKGVLVHKLTYGCTPLAHAATLASLRCVY